MDGEGQREKRLIAWWCLLRMRVCILVWAGLGWECWYVRDRWVRGRVTLLPHVNVNRGFCRPLSVCLSVCQCLGSAPPTSRPTKVCRLAYFT